MTTQPFTYDAAAELYQATWDDCLLTGTDVAYDDRHHLVVDLRATLPTGTLLNHKRLRVLDTWACQEFAKECDARPEAQMKMRQYVTLFADWLQQQRFGSPGSSNGSYSPVPSGPMPSVPSVYIPDLPEMAVLHPELTENAAPWLEAYCDHSSTWAPRAAQGFHQAVGLWLLSTVAARRICVHLGKPEYPMLFIAMIAPSTLYTKTTTAHIARRGLTQAGLKFLLTPDRITPPALIKRMSGHVEEDYGTLDNFDQEIRKRDLAFAGQRGWYYEEWGSMLGQMRRQDSVMSDFHGTLRVLNDGSDDFSSETILRGLEFVTDPSLALLCSATAADLAPYMRPGTPWWRDGFWPRFAFVTPQTDEKPSLADQPTGLDDLPSTLLKDLKAWHLHLGEPACRVEALKDGTGKNTGKWKAVRPPFQPKVLRLAPEVLKAYRTYNKALISLLIDNKVEEDLRGCYGRFHAKALRVAMLLASLQDCPQIEMRHWAYAQQVAEGWRAQLHHLIAIAASSEPMTREQAWEEKIESLLSSHGPMTAREIQKHLFRCTSQDLKNLLAAMLAIGRIVMMPKGKTQLYMVPLDAPPEPQMADSEAKNDVPF